MSHSVIVDTCLPSYSEIVDGHPGWPKCPVKGNYDIYHQYPIGVVNPAFTGMRLWELQQEHELNNYQISKHLNIKSGLIIFGTDIYIFTPISNNDIMSYIKLVLRRRNWSELNPSINTVCKKLVNYIRQRCHDRPIPSIPRIKQEFEKDFGIHQLFSQNHQSHILKYLKEHIY